MEHRYVTNHHAITFRWEFHLLLIFQDDYVSCRINQYITRLPSGILEHLRVLRRGLIRGKDTISRHEWSAPADIILPPITGVNRGLTRNGFNYNIQTFSREAFSVERGSVYMRTQVDTSQVANIPRVPPFSLLHPSSAYRFKTTRTILLLAGVNYITRHASMSTSRINSRNHARGRNLVRSHVESTCPGG